MMDTTERTLALAGWVQGLDGIATGATRDGPGSSANRNHAPNSLLSWRSENIAAPDATDQERIEKALSDLTTRLRTDTTSLQLRIDQATGAVQAEIVDAASGKVIRKIPMDELMRLSDGLRKGGTATIYEATA
ncbi:flagellar protein FlaG [Desulfolutivibrio sulfoxidireducens]|uniref:flagellar protein FlaG n=1 Tax=Desulfolutivibrio sulfoxidireducens TaxID=2773299 RepID=UPI00159D9C04|nr:flagellar protein FlaG [Desulfolutivibrio sulfoxidireducens]QLA17564.1 hypothetical protein GD605_16495 [Desulfolutivibrio sulfoxidireducens]